MSPEKFTKAVHSITMGAFACLLWAQGSALATDDQRSSGISAVTSGTTCKSPHKVTSIKLRPYINFDPESVLRGLHGWQIVQEAAMTCSINSKTAHLGDLVEARLLEDLRFGPRLIAAQDSLLRGHIVEIGSPRMFATSIVSRDRTLNSRAFVAIQFDEIITNTGCRLPIKGTPCRQKNLWQSTGSSGQALVIDSHGRIVKSEPVLTGNLHTASISARVITNLPVPGNIVVGFLAGPVAMGAIGAVSPAIAYNRPLGPHEDHCRLKAMTYGFVTNLPVVSFVLKGNEIILSPGDRLMIDISFEETGHMLPPVQSLVGLNQGLDPH